MANISHKNITNADLHEPKDINTAAVETVYVSDGAGSGTWAQAPHVYAIEADIANVSNPTSTYLVVPTAGVITRIRSVLHSGITGADSIITFFINGVPITSSTMTVTFTGSAAGSRYVSTPTANNTVAAGDLITATSDGGSSTAALLSIVFQIRVS